MRIVYHHRTRSTDAQRVHIEEIVKAFGTLGHHVEIVSLVPLDAGKSDAKRDAEEAGWKKRIRKIPWAYELVQLGYNLVGIPLLIRQLLRQRPDFIYERYALFNFAGVLAAWLFRLPIVLEVNSPFAIEQKRDGDVRSLAFAAWMERVICNAATRVIVVSSPLRRIMMDLGVQPEKLVLMTNGVNLESFRTADSNGLRARFGLNGNPVFGFVGWFRNWHGLDVLLQAFEQSGASELGAKLLLVGDGPEMPNLQDYVNRNGLEESVIFTGPILHEDVPKYLDMIDVAVQPAANEYCCPMKILEYMAMGKPIVAPSQENIRELVEDGQQGILFQPRDVNSMASALRQMIVTSDIPEMGRRGFQTILTRQYQWTANAGKVIELVEYERICRWITRHGGAWFKNGSVHQYLTGHDFKSLTVSQAVSEFQQARLWLDRLRSLGEV